MWNFQENISSIRSDLMKKFLLFILLIFILLAPPVMADDTVIVIDGKGHIFDPKPVDYEESKLVPMRAFFKALDVSISWDNETNTAVCYIDNIELKITIDSSTAYINDEKITMNVPARLIDGTTFVPLRFVGEALGYTVEWDQDTSSIVLTKDVASKVTILKDDKEDFGEDEILYTITGEASWYGNECKGNRTASGEPFNPSDFTAAHKSLPFGTQVKVTFLQTGKSITVRINDRGPHVDERIIDLSQAAAEQIGLRAHGTGMVKLEVYKKTTN
jgi:rare lipoprotein A (peptidoglycan hydrolase)